MNLQHPSGPKVGGPLAVIGVAVAAAGVAWAVIRLGGIELETGRGDDVSTVGIFDVVIAALIAGLLAWAAFSLMARKPSLLRWWPFAASTALAVSMIGPSYMADGASAMSLMALHFVTAVVLIVGFSRFIPGYCRSERSERSRSPQQRLSLFRKH